MILTNCLLAAMTIAFLVDAWYTRQWLRTSRQELRKLQAFAREHLDREEKSGEAKE